MDGWCHSVGNLTVEVTKPNRNIKIAVENANLWEKHAICGKCCNLVCLANDFFLCFFVFRFSFYCLRVLCYSHCIVTSRVCRGVFCTHNNNNNNKRNVRKSHIRIKLTRSVTISSSVGCAVSAP